MAQANTYIFKQPQRAVFVTLYEPKPFMKNGKPKGEAKYSATFVIPTTSPELATLKAAMAAVAKEKWPGRDMKELAFPLTSGDKAFEKAAANDKDGSFYKGNVVLKARSKFPPALSLHSGGKFVKLDSDALKAQWKSKFYNGCMGAAVINFIAYEGDGDDEGGKSGKDGITAYLQAFHWTGDGERIGGLDAAELFKDYAGKATTDDPFAGGDGEIPY